MDIRTPPRETTKVETMRRTFTPFPPIWRTLLMAISLVIEAEAVRTRAVAVDIVAPKTAARQIPANKGWSCVSANCGKAKSGEAKSGSMHFAAMPATYIQGYQMMMAKEPKMIAGLKEVPGFVARKRDWAEGCPIPTTAMRQSP